tara:strand:+ start:302 stop:823 length:522 start_codon:yes stop_codon:yes gene_type:complete
MSDNFTRETLDKLMEMVEYAHDGGCINEYMYIQMCNLLQNSNTKIYEMELYKENENIFTQIRERELRYGLLDYEDKMRIQFDELLSGKDKINLITILDENATRRYRNDNLLEGYIKTIELKKEQLWDHYNDLQKEYEKLCEELKEHNKISDEILNDRETLHTLRDNKNIQCNK